MKFEISDDPVAKKLSKSCSFKTLTQTDAVATALSLDVNFGFTSHKVYKIPAVTKEQMQKTLKLIQNFISHEKSILETVREIIKENSTLISQVDHCDLDLLKKLLCDYLHVMDPASDIQMKNCTR